MTKMDMMLPLSEEHLTAIGRVTAYFSLLENIANVLIADLLGLQSEDDVVSVTAHMMFLGKIQLITTLASTRFDDNKELKDLINEIIKEMDEANQKRNKIVHATWIYHSPKNNESGVLRRTARGKLKTSLEGFTPEQINEVVTLIATTTGKIQQFLINKNGELHFG